MMLDCLPKTKEGDKIRRDLQRQQEELEAKGVAYKLNGETHSGEKQFSLKPLIEALQTYNELIQRLQRPIQILEEKQAQLFGNY